MSPAQVKATRYQIESLDRAIKNEMYAARLLNGLAAIDSATDVAWMQLERQRLRDSIKVKPTSSTRR